ncbi:MAG: transcription antitermination factor NusB [Candidatus Omnitrophota bacterium]
MTRSSGFRRAGREYALRVLFGFDFLRGLGEEHPILFSPNWWKDDDCLFINSESESFARQLILSACKEQSRIDQFIQKHSKHWRLDRMSPVERNILRLSVCELLDEKGAPPKAIINEAVELAKCYGDVDSPRFLNGVLDALAANIRRSGNEPKNSG